ncbi:ATP-dependent zinc metalloprotease FtsH [Halobacteriovorax sp. HLS]|uniref:ATP-dependent zinc metalloprotease FtsH n=1 Tax=Halobacteriovorax sp. HLS TaxID=2234000 RepID=UPI000FDA42C9|nr:ATP-dependent zinc metalloprotease FtsH [Halobacteriovorax sp. HLS]
MKQQQKSWALWLFLFLAMVLLWQATSQSIKKEKIVEYSTFLQQVQSKFVSDVTFIGELSIKGTYKESYENGDKFTVIGKTDEYTKKYLLDNGVALKYQKEQSGSLFTTLLVQWAPMLILFVLFWFFLKQLQSGGGKAMSFGKSKAKLLNSQDKKVTFDDVSGVQEAKEELVEVVDFLKDPKKYTSLGGKIPKGCLLVGPPGTGKTLLARAVAGEADVPFFSISGSDFVEMFVGVGASRVRDLFEQGKKQAPCIIFIDEIDAVGRHRGHGMGGGHDEREQTLNQLLVEMDGFESNEGVIIMAATNRIDVLDPALLRPGRFDRRVSVGPPDVRGRLGILKVHAKKTPLNDNVDLEVVAKGTPGFTGADLANLVNEAALTAARLGKKKLDMGDFESAKDKVLMGPERRSMVISDKEKRVTAYHEAGHTLVGMHLPHTDPIHKVSIMPRGGALGVTQTLPSEDMHNLTRSKSENLIAFLMGGRCAEEIEFNEITNGASNDIERATQLAHSMVCSWGMSPKMGPRNFSKPGSSPFGGQGMDSIGYSEDTANSIDEEINTFIDTNYKLALKILNDNKDALDRIAEGLILWETLDLNQVQNLVDGVDIGVPIIEPKVSEQAPSEAAPEAADVETSQTSSEDAKDSDPVPVS